MASFMLYVFCHHDKQGKGKEEGKGGHQAVCPEYPQGRGQQRSGSSGPRGREVGGYGAGSVSGWNEGVGSQGAAEKLPHLDGPGAKASTP